MAPKKEMLGKLFKYGDKGVQVAFRSGNFSKQAIFIGGLTDGLLATKYVEPLAHALGAIQWSLVQPLFSSSYTGYGVSSLDQDAQEIESLIKFLVNEEGSEGVVLIGHSTGCQDIVHYLRVGGVCTRAVRGVILQGPVSDREYLATMPDTAKHLQLAEKMIAEGKKHALMPREASPEAPITAYRYHSLASPGGDDDMFSSDLPQQTLEWKLGHMALIPTAIIFSMQDEFVPPHVDKAALLKRLSKAMGGAEAIAVQGGDHSLSNRTADAVHSIIEFIRKEGPKGWDDPWT
ncbi:Predicted hydrolases or acyltransferases (alpha/beta hydrolase superfamily) [Klebsormidium nitens]|uniref:Predicted hydrolases or acyltransferases (Alpha/beta hydrolase superfamily) n=1 Tax=Klebsormidium nitens TaxID=105231 RepID=A0A1Y1IHA6_KLENI|nr:Predicted hydrolases or acyltransferases (alpha/beta hydrolase superfamily) [Klebsormidium nitens]|eukprot:GAQ88441.1 Predicted hydrolases or acyltransferases (alpha/beta hydrolase superfamily) [Klebsormidium nitens]